MNTLHTHKGFTLIELMVATGLFAVVMVLASGAYFMVINLTRQSQSIATGIDNLSFAIETMTRDIRTGTGYSSAGTGDCMSGSESNSFSFSDEAGNAVTYTLSGAALQKTLNAYSFILTDPSVTITSLLFYACGTQVVPGDYLQPRVIMVISGTVSLGAGKTPQSFTVQTEATMRGLDI